MQESDHALMQPKTNSITAIEELTVIVGGEAWEERAAWLALTERYGFTPKYILGARPVWIDGQIGFIRGACAPLMEE